MKRILLFIIAFGCGFTASSVYGNYRNTEINNDYSLGESISTYLHGVDYGFTKVEGSLDYVILRNNDSFESQVKEGNTIYVIQHDYNLQGESVYIPAGCFLRFEGGSLSNGVIVGSNTVIEASLLKVFGTNLKVTGTWNVNEIYPEWFGAKGDGNTDDTESLKSVFDVLNDLHCNLNTVFFSPKTYVISAPLTLTSHGTVIKAANVFHKDVDIFRNKKFQNISTAIIRQIGKGNILNIANPLHTRISNVTIDGLKFCFAESVAQKYHAIYSENVAWNQMHLKNISIEGTDVGIYLFSTAGAMVGYGGCSFEGIYGNDNNTLIKVYRKGSNTNNQFTYLNSVYFHDIVSYNTRHNAIWIENLLMAQNDVFDYVEEEYTNNYEPSTTFKKGLQAFLLKDIVEGQITIQNSYFENIPPTRPNNGRLFNESERITASGNIEIKEKYQVGSNVFGTILIDNCPSVNVIVKSNLFNHGDPIKVLKKSWVSVYDNDFYYVKTHQNYIVHDMSPAKDSEKSKYYFNLTDDNITPIVTENYFSVINYQAGEKKAYRNYAFSSGYYDVSSTGSEYAIGIGENATLKDINPFGMFTYNNKKAEEVVINILSDLSKLTVDGKTSKQIKRLIIEGNGHSLIIPDKTYALNIPETAYLEEIVIKNMKVSFAGDTSEFLRTYKKLKITLEGCSFTLKGSNIVSCIIKDFAGSTIIINGGNYNVASSPYIKSILSCGGSLSSSVTIPNTVLFSSSGKTIDRPVGVPGLSFPVPTGYQFYDSSLGKPIWWNGGMWTDAVGTTV